MRRTVLPLCAATLLVSMAIASLLSAQASGRRTKEQIKASYEAHQGDFDYLLGDWEFTSASREFGTGRGYWSAVRLAEGAQILDEYRVVGDSGQTYYVSSRCARTTPSSINGSLSRRNREPACKMWAPRTASARKCTSSRSSA